MATMGAIPVKKRRVSAQTTPQKRLVGGAADGGRLADLFHEFAPKVYRLALRCGLDASEAEDGVQEVFIKVQRRIDTFRGEAAFSTWLYRVALNTLRDHRRSVLRLTRALPLHDEASEFLPGDDPKPAERMESEDRKAAVRAAIDRLPSKFREVLILRELEGLAYRDIARILELPQGTIESRIFRGRERLAQDLERLRGSL